jgi:hypothetical protein
MDIKHGHTGTSMKIEVNLFQNKAYVNNTKNIMRLGWFSVENFLKLRIFFFETN